MSRTITFVGTDGRTRRLAQDVARALGRRCVDGPSRHDDEVAVVDDPAVVDTAVTAVLAPADRSDLSGLLDWAMAQGDVLTMGEHEQVMP